MKKVTVFALAFLLVMSIAVPAFAVSSPTAPVDAANKTAMLPVFVDDDSDCKIVGWYQRFRLPKEQRDEYFAAYLDLKEAVPVGMITRYFFYHFSGEICEHTVRIQNIDEIIVKEYINNKWIETRVTDNGNGTYTFDVLSDCPIAVFTNSEAGMAELLPVFEDNSSDCDIIGWLQRLRLPKAQCDKYSASYLVLNDAVPEGMITRHFFYHSSGKICEHTVRILNIDEIVVKEYVNNEWVETLVTDNGNATYTFDVLNDCPIAVFTK